MGLSGNLIEELPLDIDVLKNLESLDITIKGITDPESGFIINISELKKIVNEKIIKHLDHSEIQKDVKWFFDKQPSTENLVVFIWNQLCDNIPGDGLLYKIKLRETPSIYTEYYGPNGE